jgi:hypothetical protein
VTVINFQRRQLINGPPQLVAYDWVDILNFIAVPGPPAPPGLPWIERVHTDITAAYGRTKIRAAD